jgi:hypothetical protein
MRTPAQQAASRANGARSRGRNSKESQPRSSMDARSLYLLTKATVLKSESRKGFRELVHQHMLFFAPRNAVEQVVVEEICSATWRLYRLRAIERKAIDVESATQTSPDDLQCLVLASGELTGKNRHFHLSLQRHEPRLQNIIQRSIARLRALRQIREEKERPQIAPLGHSPEGPQCAPEP